MYGHTRNIYIVTVHVSIDNAILVQRNVCLRYWVLNQRNTAQNMVTEYFNQFSELFTITEHRQFQF